MPDRTHLAFHFDGHLNTQDTTVTSVVKYSDLEESNKPLFKGTDEDHVVVTPSTVFHPQGGGQPSDVGKMTSPSRSDFVVAAVKMDAVHDGQVLHFGRFQASEDGVQDIFQPNDAVHQSIDAEKRLLFSRLHTAGHVLGSAVRALLEKEVDNFDELKASHFPDSAACEFQGLIEGKWKEPIQKKVDEYLAAKMPVEIDWWDEEDFRKNGLERLIPDRSLAPPGEKFRIVRIVGAEVYPCGGTHVDTTDLCGETVVKKIARSKGQSRVSYTVK